MWKDPVTGEMRGGVAKVNYSHEALADAILTNPAINQRELAAIFGYSEGWISQILASDSFQAFVADRKDQILDPILRGNIEEGMRGLVLQSMERLREKLAVDVSGDLSLEVLKSASKALGYGSRVQVDARVQHVHSLVGVLSSLPPATRTVEPLQPAALPSSA